jgi:hypothetical protein
VKRIETEKKLRKQFEELEEARRLQFLKAQQESADRHSAAIRISLLYRAFKARQIFSKKRQQNKLERFIRQSAVIQQTWIPLQRVFREYSTKMWFYRKGVILDKKIGEKSKLKKGKNNKKTADENNVVDDNKKSKNKKIKPPDKAIDKNLLVTEADLNGRMIYEVRQRRVQERSLLISKFYDKHVDATEVNILITS